MMLIITSIRDIVTSLTLLKLRGMMHRKRAGMLEQNLSLYLIAKNKPSSTVS